MLVPLIFLEAVFTIYAISRLVKSRSALNGAVLAVSLVFLGATILFAATWTLSW
jgi:hypothetical protein